MTQPTATVASYSFDWASQRAATGSSNAPGTSTVFTSSAETPAAANARSAPSRSACVIGALNRARTMANRLRFIYGPSFARHTTFSRRQLWLVEEMAKLLLLHPEIAGVVVMEIGDKRHATEQLQAVAFEAGDLARIVRDDPHLSDAQIVEDLRSDAVLAFVGRQPELEVRLDGVCTAILQLVCAQLVG